VSTPIILVCGPAGSGKDTVASTIAKNHNGVCIALADPMKRLAFDVFGFTELQLWGPSEFRNAPDPRFTDTRAGDTWAEVEKRMRTFAPRWLDSISLYPGKDNLSSLWSWIDSVRFEAFKRDELTPRYVLQTLGTEWGRGITRDVWINVGMRTAETLLSGGPRYNRTVGLTDDVGYHPPDFVVITDGRFRNEVLKVKMAGGITMRVNPTIASNDAETVEAAGVAGHLSEAELGNIPRHFYTYILDNDKSKGLGSLDNRIHYLMQALKHFMTAQIGDFYDGVA
jgi:hypothetical protein